MSYFGSSHWCCEEVVQVTLFVTEWCNNNTTSDVAECSIRGCHLTEHDIIECVFVTLQCFSLMWDIFFKLIIVVV